VQVTALSIPVKGEIISGGYFDGIRSLDIAHDIASHINGRQILNGRVIITSLTWCAIVCWDTDAFESSLVNTVHEDALS
jgi:hypothetical protein